MRLTSLRVFPLLALLAVSPLFGEVLTNCADIAALPAFPTNGIRPETACLVGQVLSLSNPAPREFYLHDTSGFVPVRSPDGAVLSVGDIYRVRGRIESFKYGLNTVLADAAELVRHEPTPEPVEADFQRIRDGELICQFVTLAGLVIDAFPDEVDPGFVWLLVRNHGVTIPIATSCPGNRREACRPFIGKRISTVGLCLPISGRRRFGGSYVGIRGLEALHIEESDEDIFAAPFFDPLHPGKALVRYCQEGFVIGTWGDRQLMVFSGVSKEFEVRLRDDAPLPAVGSRIRVSGFLERTAFYPRLVQASWRPADDAPFRYTVRDRSPREILAARAGAPAIESRFHGRLIRLTGTLRNTPTRLGDETRLYLESDGYLIPIDATAVSPEILSALVPDMKLAVSGLCLMEYDESRMIAGFPRLKGFSLVVRDDDDIRILARPPWWTPARLLAVIGSLIGLVVAALVWGWWLNRLVERRSRELAHEQIAHRNAESRREDRTRLAVELHDSLSQNLAAVAFQISSAKGVQSADPARAAERLGTAEKMLDSCRSELRNCLGDLRSNALEQRDFEQAVRQTVDQVRCDAEVRVSFPIARTRLSDSVAHAILMILRELVSNAVRHGQARLVDIRGELAGETLSFCVSDDGHGFDTGKRPGIREGHFGVEGIRQRAKRLNGTFALESTPGAGTKATLTIPIGDCAS